MFCKLQVSFRREGDVAALQGDLAQQEVVQRRLVQLLGRGLRGCGTRRERQHSGKNIFWHLASTHLRYIWCPAQACRSMPELPEVEVTRRGLLPHISGRVISGVEIREPRLRWPVPPAVRRLAGRTIRSIRRRGKYLLVDCGDGHLILHLGMSGSLRLLPPGTPAGKHDHFDLLLGDRILRLRDPRRFGAVLWAPGRVEAHPLLDRKSTRLNSSHGYISDAVFCLHTK